MSQVSHNVSGFGLEMMAKLVQSTPLGAKGSAASVAVGSMRQAVAQ